MSQQISTVSLFTVAACPAGRNIGTVFKELQAEHPELMFATHYFDMQPELANQYRIKENPTVLFLDARDVELYRFVGFKETAEINRIMEQVEQGSLQADDSLAENETSTETYTIFLYQDGQPIPIEVEYQNPTSVRTPRITAVQLLIKSQVEGYENPFPPATALNLVQFPQNVGHIHLTVPADPDEATQEKMRTVLTKTLEAFGVADVKMILAPANQ